MQSHILLACSPISYWQWLCGMQSHMLLTACAEHWQICGTQSRDSSRKVSQGSRNQSGLLNLHNFQSTLIKQSRVIDKILIIWLWYCSSHLFICLFLFTRGGYRGGSKCTRLLYSHLLHIILRYFLSYALIQLLSVTFSLAHETICILW